MRECEALSQDSFLQWLSELMQEKGARTRWSEEGLEHLGTILAWFAIYTSCAHPTRLYPIKCIHPEKLTWNLKNHPIFQRKIIFQTTMTLDSMFFAPKFTLDLDPRCLGRWPDQFSVLALFFCTAKSRQFHLASIGGSLWGTSETSTWLKIKDWKPYQIFYKNAYWILLVCKESNFKHI